MQGIPSWFVTLYGQEFGDEVQLSYEGGLLLWKISLKKWNIKNKPHVAFAKGWEAFCQFHFVEKGNEVKFTLVSDTHLVVEHVHHD